MNKRLVIPAAVIIALLIGSVAYYISSITCCQPPTQRGPTEASLVPPLVIAQATLDSDPIPNSLARLASDDLSQSGLGISSKLYTADSGTVIYAKLYYGDLPGGYDALTLAITIC